MTMEVFSRDWVPLLILIATVIGFIFVWFSIKQAGKWNRLTFQHSFLNTASSIELEKGMLKQLAEINIHPIGRKEPLTPEETESIISNIDAYMYVVGFLNEFENICCAVQTGVADPTISYKIHSARIVINFPLYKPFIDAIRKRDNDNEIWIEFEKCYEQWKAPLNGSETFIHMIKKGLHAGDKSHTCNHHIDSKSEVAKHSEINVKQRGKLRLLIELVSLTTIFLFLSIILFSMTKDTIPIIGHSFHIHNIHILFWVLGSFSALFSLASLILMFFPSKAESLGDVIENSQKHSYAFGVFWPALWFAIVITFVAGLVDTSNRISNPTGRAIAFFSGVIIFLCAAYKIISLGSKRKKL